MGLLKTSVVLMVVFYISTVKGIKGGFNAYPMELPYHAFIDVYHRQSHIHSCSGAVINEKFVITSFICVEMGDRYRIILGSVNPTKAGDNPAYDHETKIKFYTPVHNTANEGYIALLKVEVVINFSNRVQPVTLPFRNDGPINDLSNPNICKLHYMADASGYEGSDTNHLQILYVAVVPTDYCSLFFPANLLRTQPLCGRGLNQFDNEPNGSLCGEKGVPLVLPGNQTLIGIFDYTNNTCQSGAPNLFINIERFLQWIDETTTQNW